MGNTYGYQYGYPVEASTAEGVAGFMIAFLGVFYLLMFAVAVAVYVFQSLSLYTIAKRRGIHNPWLAWLPVGNMWITGCISDQYQYVVKGRVRNRRKILLGLTIGMFAILVVMFGSLFSMILGAAGDVGALTGVGFAMVLLAYFALFVVAIVAAVFQYIAIYDLYRSCDPDNAVLYLVLSIFFNICLPIFFFICRKKDGGMPPRKPAEPVLQVTEPVIQVQQAPAAETAEVPAEETAASEQTEE